MAAEDLMYHTTIRALTAMTYPSDRLSQPNDLGELVPE
jgi:hypothetical protein